MTTKGRQTLGIISDDPMTKPSLWRPLRISVFRNLLAANVVSDIGTFMQVVGAAWLMLSLKGGPTYVALIQTASALPYVLLALPAGAVGDIVDRRKPILFTETWILSVAVVLTIVTFAGRITPPLLLLLTFALSAGDAFETPTWRAVMPELVTKVDLPSAAALNGIEFNFARAVGPALAGAVIAVWGVGRAFLLNALSFVIARWKRLQRKHTVPVETLSGATIAALRQLGGSRMSESTHRTAAIVHANLMRKQRPGMGHCLQVVMQEFHQLAGCISNLTNIRGLFDGV